ncbi:hypothetical protein Dda_8493 [Drechslerella dactyloides]|uniref:Apple domain-containing protein n=1 Tax=Drechslerella dactyloides TaxID=74499 RepID=A0AAD6NHB8_DREDA|nr:hypothetical protein Dda_8493 [Drechslerella dactyloides]
MGKISTIIPIGGLTLLLAAGSAWAAPAEAALVGRGLLVKRALEQFTQKIGPNHNQIIDPNGNPNVISGDNTPQNAPVTEEDCAAQCLAQTGPPKCESFQTYRRRLVVTIPGFGQQTIDTKYFCVLYSTAITGPSDASISQSPLPGPFSPTYKYDQSNGWTLTPVVPPVNPNYDEVKCLADGMTFTPRKYSDGAKPDIGLKNANTKDECLAKCDEVTNSNRATAISGNKNFWYACNGVVFGYNDMAQTEPFCFLYYINWDQTETGQIYTISKPPKKNVCFYNKNPAIGDLEEDEKSFENLERAMTREREDMHKERGEDLKRREEEEEERKKFQEEKEIFRAEREKFETKQKALGK